MTPVTKFFNFVLTDDNRFRFQLTEVKRDEASKNGPLTPANATSHVFFLTQKEMESLIRNALSEFSKMSPNQHLIETPVQTEAPK